MRKKQWFLFVLIGLMVAACSLPKFSLFPEAGPLKETTLQGSGEEKILVVPVEGVISTQGQERLLRSSPSMVEQIMTHLKHAEKDPKIKALLLKVNSPGGSVTASDILYHELSAYKQRTGVKMVVVMMNLAASGGYYISLPADWILAHPTTVTGSIGVIFARPGVSGFMEKYGLAMEVSKSGEQKDMGSPFKAPTDVERVIFQDLTDTLARRFLDLVTKHRNINPTQQQRIATARVFLPEEAKELGLVDQIGYLNDAIEKTRELAGLGPDARVITFKRHESEDDTIYNPSGRQDTLDAQSSSALLNPLRFFPEAGFYYMWPGAF
jgi:protease-4